jgi:hypothetical protein
LVISQRLLYAIALSKRTGLHLKHIRIAWFDEKDYFKVAAMEAYAAFYADLHTGNLQVI